MGRGQAPGAEAGPSRTQTLALNLRDGRAQDLSAGGEDCAASSNPTGMPVTRLEHGEGDK